MPLIQFNVNLVIIVSDE